MISRRTSIGLLLVVTAVLAIAFFIVPPFAQPQSYHAFADHRTFLGVPNFANLISNLPFAVVGLWALAFLVRLRPHEIAHHFIDARERWPYLLVFFGLFLTALGSSYYHLRPDNTRLLWDRLPMMIVFMALVAAVIAERISVRAGLWLLPLLLALGAGSVLQWSLSELHGAGDLRLYAAVQVYSGLVLLLALLFPPRYTRASDLAVVVGFYVLAKLLELLDKPIFAAGHILSGHTLKHLAGAAAGYWIFRMLEKRAPLPERD